MAQAIVDAQEKYFPCSICGYLTDIDPCLICSDPGPIPQQPVRRRRSQRYYRD